MEHQDNDPNKNSNKPKAQADTLESPAKAGYDPSFVDSFLTNSVQD
jgi:hypothetical protein